MYVAVDEAICIGSGCCERVCPEVFRVEGVSVVTDPAPHERIHERVREAAHECPTAAILIQTPDET